ncbi:hypothetical protein H4219_001031 [Mycoemilia scoparia]|uniref:Ribonuclease H2 subunit B n=1 Tax=Mycoemilia scoparia TaxID=417184 RepID=A0A9W8A155_9FUNG|nr:hypothetical protein H4219_001031 [Mycoemilia scoparia]
MANASSAIVILPDNGTEGLVHYEALTLPHPRTGESSSFYLDSRNSKMFEASDADHYGSRSWIAHNKIYKDGSFTMFTQIDPTFLLVPILQSCCRCFKNGNDSNGRYIQVDSLPFDAGFDSNLHVASLESLVRQGTLLDCALKNICDVQGSYTKVVKFDKARTLQWLKNKVAIAAINYEKTPALMEMTKRIESFKPIPQELKQSIHEYQIVLLISEYLPQSWVDTLMKEYDDFKAVKELETELEATTHASFSTPTDYFNIPKQSTANPKKKTASVKDPKSGPKKISAKDMAKTRTLTSFFAKSSK